MVSMGAGSVAAPAGEGMNLNWIEIFGTASSVVVAVSLTMKNIRRLRILNAAGALGFMIYGIAIGSLPVWILNGFIVLIDLWYLWRMRVERDRFDVIESDPYSSPYVGLFLAFHKEDIARYQPEFRLEPGRGWLTEFILRDLNPVSIIIYRRLDERTIEIGLDYAVPSYRDFQSARYYFDQAAKRIAAGQSLVFIQRTAVPEHQRYLEKLGFIRDRGQDDAVQTFRLSLTGR